MEQHYFWAAVKASSKTREWCSRTLGDTEIHVERHYFWSAQQSMLRLHGQASWAVQASTLKGLMLAFAVERVNLGICPDAALSSRSLQLCPMIRPAVNFACLYWLQQGRLRPINCECHKRCGGCGTVVSFFHCCGCESVQHLLFFFPTEDEDFLGALCECRMSLVSVTVSCWCQDTCLSLRLFVCWYSCSALL